MESANPPYIRALLACHGISEPTYHTLLRLAAFMRPRRKGQGKFPRDCLLALKAFSLLRAHGVATLDAVRAVEDVFPAISRFVQEPSQAPKLKVRLLPARGMVRLARGSVTDTSSVEEVGHIELDFRGIASLLAVSEPMP